MISAVVSVRLSYREGGEGTDVVFHPFLMAELRGELGKRSHFSSVQEETPKIHWCLFCSVKRNCSDFFFYLSGNVDLKQPSLSLPEMEL